MNRVLVTSIILALSAGFSARAATVTGGVNSGGGVSSSVAYALDASVGNIAGNSAGGSVSNSGGGSVTMPSVQSLGLTASPASVNQGGTSQLIGTATMDDQTVTALAGADLAWGFVTYPFQSVDSNGVLTAVASVYSTATGKVNGAYLGVAGSTSVPVFGPYANAGIPDSWLVQYFGLPPNANAAPTADADGTGQNNLFKYTAGLDPTNPASVFMLKIASVTGQPTQKLLTFRPWATGRTYALQYRTNLVFGSYGTLTGYTGPQTNSTEISVTDLNATGASKFYRIDITYP